MTSTRRQMFFITTLFLISSVMGCGQYGATRYTSSVVEYLYPKKEVAEVPTIPRLSLPLRVGIAFVPESGGSHARLTFSEKKRWT